jgi:adenosine deaminase
LTASIKKAELHCHIEGAASPELVKAQARKYGADVSAFIADTHYVWSDFTEFLAAYDGAAALFRSEEDYALLAGPILRVSQRRTPSMQKSSFPRTTPQRQG